MLCSLSLASLLGVLNTTWYVLLIMQGLWSWTHPGRYLKQSINSGHSYLPPCFSCLSPPSYCSYWLNSTLVAHHLVQTGLKNVLGAWSEVLQSIKGLIASGEDHLTIFTPSNPHLCVHMPLEHQPPASNAPSDAIGMSNSLQHLQRARQLDGYIMYRPPTALPVQSLWPALDAWLRNPGWIGKYAMLFQNVLLLSDDTRQWCQSTSILSQPGGDWSCMC